MPSPSLHPHPATHAPAPIPTYARSRTQLRGGYYPRVFYPGLYNAKERFLKNFETMYYLKALPGGWIFRKAPEDWQIVSIRQEEKRGQKAVASRVLTSTTDRPEYNKAIQIIQKAAREAQQGAGDGEDMD
ncbi:unnamed protein product [Laminaria digitata]